MTKQRLDSGQEVALLDMELDVQETDSSIYAWTTGEELNPEGYQQASIPHGQIPESVPWPWSPGYVAPLRGDAVYPQGPKGRASFGLEPIYMADAQGNQVLTCQIKGFPPFADLDTTISKPIIAAAGTTGGTIPAGQYVVALAPRDSGAVLSYKVADFLAATNVTVSDSGAISVTVTDWGSGDDGGDLYVARWNANEEFTWHYQTTLGTDVGGATITNFDESKPGGPDPLFDHFGIVWQEIVHSGPWADTIAALTANTITIGCPNMRNNQWQGYTLSLLAKAQQGVEIPVLNMPIIASTASDPVTKEFTLTIGPNSAGDQLPDLTTLLAVGDLVVMRHRATFTATSFSDPNIANGFFPDGATGVEQGHLAIMLSGADIGDVQTIDSVSQDSNGKDTIFNLKGSWKVTPQTGDIVVICSPTQADFYATNSIQVTNTANGPIIIAQPVIDNLANKTWLLIVSTLNSQNRDGDVQYMPMRDVYFFGAGGTRTITASTTMLPVDGIVKCDATNGPITFTLLPQLTVINQRLRVEKIDATANTVTIVCATYVDSNGNTVQDSVTDDSGTWTSKTLTTQYDFVFLPGF